ncbi:MAG TPA: hypothetical protein VF244_01480 [Acidimicrobiales bacterium]
MDRHRRGTLSATSDDARPVEWIAPLAVGVGLTLVAAALGNYLLPLGTGELVAAVVLGALLPRRPFRTGALLVVAPAVVLVADAAGRSPGRVVGALVIAAVAALFLGFAAGAGAQWRGRDR